jgi:pSer/pThr/pTyr-binding forkhead associated (FHA) protein
VTEPHRKLPHLVVADSTGRIPLGARVALTHSPMILGRTAGADILVPSLYVARRHCRFERREGAWWIADVQSSGGVYVNDLRITEHRLSPGDRIHLGDATLVFDPDGVDIPRTAA